MAEVIFLIIFLWFFQLHTSKLMQISPRITFELSTKGEKM